jgi:hypothetical protein
MHELYRVLIDHLNDKERLWLSTLTAVNKRLGAMSISGDQNSVANKDMAILLGTVELLFHEPMSGFKRPELVKLYLEVV